MNGKILAPIERVGVKELQGDTRIKDNVHEIISIDFAGHGHRR